MKKRTGMIVAGLALVAAGGAWWLEHATRPEETSSAIVETKEVSAAPRVVVPLQPSGKKAEGALATSTEPDAGSESSLDAPANGGRPTVSDILAEPEDDLVKVAKKLAAMVADGTQPMVEREEALAHTLNLAAGNEAEVFMPLIKDPALPKPLTETILAEALNQSLGYQADLYLAALAVHKDPEIQAQIREHLKFLTGGEDRGTDLAAWRADIDAERKEWAE